jgi:hypothetical protein
LITAVHSLLSNYLSQQNHKWRLCLNTGSKRPGWKSFINVWKEGGDMVWSTVKWESMNDEKSNKERWKCLKRIKGHK